MKKESPNLTDNMEGFLEAQIDFTQYEVSFRRWLVSEIDAGRMSVNEAREKFQLPAHAGGLIRAWQKKYSEEYQLTLPTMKSKELSEVNKLQKRIEELEKQLDLSKMKIVALETLIDVAEEDLKIEIRKKAGPGQ